MKCAFCGGNIISKNGIYLCEFCGSTYLKEEIVATNSKNVDRNDFVIEAGMLTKYRGTSQIVHVPQSVTSIGPGAFKGNRSLKEICFSTNVLEICERAFEGCSNLESLRDYESVQSFGDFCFAFTGLREIKIGSAVKHLGRSCFSNIVNLTKLVYMPRKNLRLNGTFYGCVNLKDVSMDEKYFFPSVHTFLEVRNNPDNKKPTFGDVFIRTPYIKAFLNKCLTKCEMGVCFVCGGKVKKGLFHARCSNCGIDYKN